MLLELNKENILKGTFLVFWKISTRKYFKAFWTGNEYSLVFALWWSNVMINNGSDP